MFYNVIVWLLHKPGIQVISRNNDFRVNKLMNVKGDCFIYLYKFNFQTHFLEQLAKQILEFVI